MDHPPKHRSRPVRILHAPHNVGGNPIGLSRAERDLGFSSDVAVVDAHPFGYEADIDLRSKPRRVSFLAQALLRYDVFHFNFGQTILTRNFYGEVRLARRLGKVVLATFQGDDARPPSANPAGSVDAQYREWQRRSQSKARKIMLRYAHRVFFIVPDLRHWLPGAQFRAYANVDPRALRPTPLPDRKQVVVGHAPSNRAVKGTEAVIDAIQALRGEGLPIELELVENVSHDEALERYARCDLAIDQLRLGYYAGFAVEMMALGRPVLCHIREDEPSDNPFGDELPIVRTTAEQLRDDLRALATDPARRRSIGAASRRFVERHHDPRNIARQNLEGLVPIPNSERTV